MNKLIIIAILLLFGCSKKENLDEIVNVEFQLPSESENIEINESVEQKGIPCLDGFAEIYPCSGYDLLSHIPLSKFRSESANDNWGWTDPSSGKEYVLSGLDDGTAFIDISDPKNPIFLGKLLTESSPSPWRDIKVYKNFAFIVSEAPNHGLQVFDLTRLRNQTQEFQNFSADTTLSDFGNAHNLWINESTGYAYVFGSNLYQGGPLFIDINDPLNPEIVGGYADDSYSHDAQIVNYKGPDTEFRGREILFGSNSDGGENNQIVIIDVTNKSNPIKISSKNYLASGYTHQGILSKDQKYFFLGDELDELIYGTPTLTRIFDLSELSNPKIHLNYFAQLNAIDHNGYIKEDLFYMANYTAGLRVLDISQVQNKRVNEIGFFDTFPSDNNPKFNGAWNVYPFFDSGVIAISDIDSGLFLVKESE